MHGEWEKVRRSLALPWIAWPLWVVLGYFASAIGAHLLNSLIVTLGWPSLLSSTSSALLFQAGVSVAILALVVGVPYAKKLVTPTTLGLQRSLGWADLGLGIAGYIVYFVLFMVVTVVLTKLVPAYNAGQAQDLGFTMLFGPERLAAFVAYVIVAPLAEEIIMRGFLLGKLTESKLPFWPAAIVVSLLFGLAHGQWNVGIDTFILSMVACYLRRATKTVWPGVVIHMTKNMVAYLVLFVFMIR